MGERDDVDGQKLVETSVPDSRTDVADTPRGGRRVHEIWESPPTLRWLPITSALLGVLVGPLPNSDPPRHLTGIQMALLLHVACIWRFWARASRFRIKSVELATQMGVSRSCIFENLRALGRDGLLDVGHAKINNQLGIDVQPLRRAVSGTTIPLAGSPRGVGPFELWGHTKDRPTRFVGIPELLIAQMATGAAVDGHGACPTAGRPADATARPQTWKVLLLLAYKYARCGRRVFLFDVRRAAAFTGLPERSLRRALQSLAEAGWIRKSGERPRGRWVVDVAPLVKRVAEAEADPGPEKSAPVPES